MSRTVLLYLRALLAVLALLGFIFLFGRAIIEAFSAASTPNYSDAYVYTATVLAGLVGGVAATGLSQQLPDREQGFWNGLGKMLAPLQPENLQKNLAVVYTVIYILTGVAALIAWVAAKPEAPVNEMLKNLALIFLGLAIATAQSFFGIENQAVKTKMAVKHTRSRKRHP
jgi:hypothetical protein